MPEDGRSLGNRGEEIARRYLEQKGFRLVARNVRTRFGELDLVCRHGETLVFIEVKTRRAGVRVGPLDAVSQSKAGRLVRLAEAYVAEHWKREIPWRIDVVAVEFDRGGQFASVTHIPNAVEDW